MSLLQEVDAVLAKSSQIREAAMESSYSQFAERARLTIKSVARSNAEAGIVDKSQFAARVPFRDTITFFAPVIDRIREDPMFNGFRVVESTTGEGQNTELCAVFRISEA